MPRLLKYTLRAILSILLLAVLGIAIARLNTWRTEDQMAAVLAPANGRMVETGEGAIHVSIWGEESAPAVLMTHGMAAWGGLWEETALALAKNGYRVIALGQPPFGEIRISPGAGRLQG